MYVLQVFRAVLYMDQRDKILKPICTEHFIVVPKKRYWSLSKKLLFNQSGQQLESHPFFFQFSVNEKTHAADIYEDDTSKMTTMETLDCDVGEEMAMQPQIVLYKCSQKDQSQSDSNSKINDKHKGKTQKYVASDSDDTDIEDADDGDEGGRERGRRGDKVMRNSRSRVSGRNKSDRYKDDGDDVSSSESDTDEGEVYSADKHESREERAQRRNTGKKVKKARDRKLSPRKKSRDYEEMSDDEDMEQRAGKGKGGRKNEKDQGRRQSRRNKSMNYKEMSDDDDDFDADSDLEDRAERRGKGKIGGDKDRRQSLRNKSINYQEMSDDDAEDNSDTDVEENTASEAHLKTRKERSSDKYSEKKSEKDHKSGKDSDKRQSLRNKSVHNEEEADDSDTEENDVDNVIQPVTRKEKGQQQNKGRSARDSGRRSSPPKVVINRESEMNIHFIL